MRTPRPLRLVLAALAVSVVSTSCATSSPGHAATTQSSSPAATAGAGNCDYQPSGKPAKDVAPPPNVEPGAGAATVTLKLPGGDVVLSLDRGKTPCTTGSFVHLAKAGFFDGTPCHRLTATASLSVLQCGDPTGSGTGGPGYTFADETDPAMTYPAGTVAMANSGPDTNGSQFFLVYADSQLPPSYTVFGKVTGGMDVLASIGSAGAVGGRGDGAPVKPVIIGKAEVTG